MHATISLSVAALLAAGIIIIGGLYVASPEKMYGGPPKGLRNVANSQTREYLFPELHSTGRSPRGPWYTLFVNPALSAASPRDMYIQLLVDQDAKYFLVGVEVNSAPAIPSNLGLFL